MLVPMPSSSFSIRKQRVALLLLQHADADAGTITSANLKGPSFMLRLAPSAFGCRPLPSVVGYYFRRLNTTRVEPQSASFSRAQYAVSLFYPCGRRPSPTVADLGSVRPPRNIMQRHLCPSSFTFGVRDHNDAADFDGKGSSRQYACNYN
jgi:hypothetical protein